MASSYTVSNQYPPLASWYIFGIALTSFVLQVLNAEDKGAHSFMQHHVDLQRVRHLGMRHNGGLIQRQRIILISLKVVLGRHISIDRDGGSLNFPS